MVNIFNKEKYFFIEILNFNIIRHVYFIHIYLINDFYKSL